MVIARTSLVLSCCALALSGCGVFGAAVGSAVRAVTWEEKVGNVPVTVVVDEKRGCTLVLDGSTVHVDGPVLVGDARISDERPRWSISCPVDPLVGFVIYFNGAAILPGGAPTSDIPAVFELSETPEQRLPPPDGVVVTGSSMMFRHGGNSGWARSWVGYVFDPTLSTLVYGAGIDGDIHVVNGMARRFHEWDTTNPY